jgi:ribosomal protein L35
MARQKTRKTAAKRIRKTNPKGNRKAKLMYSKTAQHHLMTKRSRRVKRRKPNKAVVSEGNAKNFRKIIKNI